MYVNIIVYYYNALIFLFPCTVYNQNKLVNYSTKSEYLGPYILVNNSFFDQPTKQNIYKVDINWDQ